jgi:hypothetical protein
MTGSSTTKEISLGDGLGEIAVRVNGAVIEVHEDGSVAAHTSGDVDVYTDASVCVHPAANDNGKAKTAARADLKPGDRMADGSIYAGISPHTHKAMYVTAADASLTMKWKKAMDYAAGLDAHGRQDWRVPTKAELNLLWENRDKGALKATFNVTGSDPAGWYWSSTEIDYTVAWAQRFSNGDQLGSLEFHESSLRCVRG